MSARAKKPAAAPRKKANGYKMPDPIPTGEVIHDTLMKKKWRIGPSIGVGGFGEIYSACDHESAAKKATQYPFVIKIEPHENGPLFVEKHFYVRNASQDEITKYMKSKKLSSLGMPTYFGNGSHEHNGVKYRYLVLERYGKDMWNIFKECGRKFPVVTVFQLGLQMLDVLEYIHSRGYVHADIKGANILLGLKKGTENQAYLVDFGLATRVNDKEFKPDPKCAHNGTIEYTSRDAHLGVATMRGDLEILGYNMLQWIVSELPWEKSLKQPKTVQELKENFLKNVRANITKQYKNVPDALIKFFEYINTLKPKDVPDYSKCRQLFESYLKSEGKTRSSKMEFTSTKTKTKDNIVVDSENTDTDDNAPFKKTTKKATKAPADTNESPKRKRGRKPKVVENSDTENETPNGKDSPQKVQKRKLVKATSELSSSIDSETGASPEKNAKTSTKAIKSPKASAIVNKLRRNAKATPPAKLNHANMGTQTSGEKRKRSPRQVSFDSPICEIIGEKRAKNLKDSSIDSANSSGDLFDDSFTMDGKKKPNKRRLISTEEVTVKRVVTKKVVGKTKVPTKRSWKDQPTIVNGSSAH